MDSTGTSEDADTGFRSVGTVAVCVLSVASLLVVESILSPTAGAVLVGTVVCGTASVGVLASRR